MERHGHDCLRIIPGFGENYAQKRTGGRRMTYHKRKNNKAYDDNLNHHEAAGLFSEWPTPADTVAGFGGNPDKSDKSQWKMKKDAPDTR
jgi:hypothetical protein